MFGLSCRFTLNVNKKNVLFLNFKRNFTAVKSNIIILINNINININYLLIFIIILINQNYYQIYRSYLFLA